MDQTPRPSRFGSGSTAAATATLTAQEIESEGSEAERSPVARDPTVGASLGHTFEPVGRLAAL
ncbi:exported hypothetical protein [Mesorhizobium sp. ORS 3324]|nr:exported hypothetical protein [Mesorhizobium sp. ORS 3324]